MIYNIDTIPAKVFLKVSATEDLSLLTTDKKVSENDLKKAWDEILKADPKKNKNTDKNRVLDLSKKLQRASNKYNSLQNALFFLSQGVRDKEVEQIVKDYNYKLTEDNFKEDVLKALSLIDGISVKISKYQQEIDDIIAKQNQGETATFEDNLMLYYRIAGISIKDANTITYLEYLGLEKQVETVANNLAKSNGAR